MCADTGKGVYACVIHNELCRKKASEVNSLMWAGIQENGFVRWEKSMKLKTLNVELRDMCVFGEESRESGRNPCSEKNGGCDQLCLYGGTQKFVCRCSFGRIGEDGKSCVRKKNLITRYKKCPRITLWKKQYFHQLLFSYFSWILQ